MSENSTLVGVMLELHARAPENNRYRSWRIEIDRDLFGHLNARITFGRIGTTGRTIRWDFDTEAAAATFLRTRLRRRASGTKRRGASYRVSDASPHAIPLIAGLLPVDCRAE